MSERARKSPRLLRRSSSVQVHSLSDLSKVTNEALTTKEDVEENDASSTTTFEEVPGAWSGGIDDEDVPTPIEVLSDRTRCQLVTGFVFSILTLIAALFLIASVINGGLPRYGVEQAEKIIVFYDGVDVFEGDIKRDGNWNYYRFQTHHEVENITVQVKAIATDPSTIIPPLAVYLKTDMVPTVALDINGTSILQGAATPGSLELDNLIQDQMIVCGPRTTYVGITLPYWTPATASLDPVHYELSVHREIPNFNDGLCEKERFRALIFVQVLQPIAVFVCFITCLISYGLGIFNRHKLHKMIENEPEIAHSGSLENESLIKESADEKIEAQVNQEMDFLV